jgi:two-component system, LytTR family, sensor histidine kinase AlgZ
VKDAGGRAPAGSRGAALELLGAVLRWSLLGLAGFLVLLLPFGEPGLHFARSYWSRAVVYSLLCTSVTAVAIEGLGPRVATFRFPFNVLAGLVVLVTCALLGTVLGLFVLGALGVADPADLGVELSTAMRFNLALSLVVGGSAFVYEALRGRLSETEGELRHRELAEARALALATEARLAALAARIHPHFLFNTLNSIAALIPEDPARAERMVERLSALLRALLEGSSRPLISLREELETADEYLEIEKVRFGERLSWLIDVPAELHHTVMPPLALQTLLENSVKHGVAARREPVSIRVTGRHEHDQMVLVVADDGPGFDGPPFPEGHGLDVLRSRLAVLFGPRGTLTVRRVGRVTEVCLRTPLGPADQGGRP